MRKKLLLLCLVIISCCKLYAQNIVLVSGAGDLYSLDNSSGSCVTQVISNGCHNYPFSIALYKDTLYSVSMDVSTGRYIIFQSKLNSPYCKKIDIALDANNLTVDSAGVVYWIDQGWLRSYDPHTESYIEHGYVWFNPAGDLIFYKNKLYMAADGGELVEVNIEHPEESTVYMTLDRTFYGLVNVPVGCNKNQVFGIEDGGSSSNLIEIDMENKTVGSVYCTVPFSVWDAASITETGIVKGISIAEAAVRPDCGNNGNSGSIAINALSASPGALDFFINGTATNNTGIFNNLAAGSYNFHIVSSEGCFIDTTLSVEKSAPIALAIKALADTCNAATGSIAVNPSGNFGTLTYYLNNILQPANVYTGLKPGTYTISATDTNSCRVDSTVTIQNTTLPLSIASIDIQPATCKTGSGEVVVHATSTVALSFALNNSSPQSAGLFTGLNAGTYPLRMFAAYCRFDSVIIIPQKPLIPPGITFTATAPTCSDEQDGSLQFGLFNGLPPFAISLGNTYSTASFFPQLDAGLYPVKIKDANDCVWDTSAIVPAYVPQKPVVNYSIKQPQCFLSLPGELTVNITGAEMPYSFFVDNKRYNAGTRLTHLLPGNYQVKIFNNNDCMVDSSTIALTAANNGAGCDTILVPTAFTPGNDGLNDVLKPTISNFPANISFSVYNRFGENIFRTTKLNEGWNGSYKNIPQPAGSYVWTCSYTTTSGVKKQAKGVIVLIR